MRVKIPLLTYEDIKSVSERVDTRVEDTIMKQKAQFRRTRVNQLRLRGYTNQEIAQKIGCSLSTIEKDLYIIRESSRTWFEEQSIIDYCQSVNDAVIFCDNAIEDLQAMYNNESSLEVKGQILVLMGEMEIKKAILYEKTRSVQRYLSKKDTEILKPCLKYQEVKQ